MKRIKKSFLVFLALVILLAAAACAPANKTARATDTGKQSPSPSASAPDIAAPSPSQKDEQSPILSAGAASGNESAYFTVKEYKVYYRVVPQNDYAQVVGDLEEYVDSESVDMENNRVLYIQYTGIEENGEELKIAIAWRNIPWGKLIFSVGGAEYRQPALLMSSATQVYVTYLFVPDDTPDDVAVSISYNE